VGGRGRPVATRATAAAIRANAASVRHVGASPKYHHANATNTPSDTTSCTTFSAVGDSTFAPTAFAGTWRAYSGRAISQLTRMRTQNALSGCFRCPYQATVMNVFDAIKSRIADAAGCIASPP
jgi:hypothetical protein